MISKLLDGGWQHVKQVTVKSWFDQNVHIVINDAAEAEV